MRPTRCRLSDEWKMTVNGQAAYTSRNLSTQAIDDPLGNTFLNARTLVNASITLAQAENHYYVRVVGKNLTDKRYRVASQNVARPVAQLAVRTVAVHRRRDRVQVPRSVIEAVSSVRREFQTIMHVFPVSDAHRSG